jgi:hypothetical protein
VSGPKYDATVHPDGDWSVVYYGSAYHHSRDVANGKANSEHEAEIEARIAIEQDKCRRSCSDIKAKHVRRFSVRG